MSKYDACANQINNSAGPLWQRARNCIRYRVRVDGWHRAVVGPHIVVLEQMTKRDILKLKNMGVKTLALVLGAMADHGVYPSDYRPDTIRVETDLLCSACKSAAIEVINR